MAQVINTNVAALFAGAALNKSAIALQTAQQRLSSGVRINSAKDDATGLVTATNTDAAIRAANVSIRTENDTISHRKRRTVIWASSPKTCCALPKSVQAVQKVPRW